MIKALNAATAQAIDDPVLRDNFTKASMETIGGPPEQLGRLARFDSDKYATGKRAEDHDVLQAPSGRGRSIWVLTMRMLAKGTQAAEGDFY